MLDTDAGLSPKRIKVLLIHPGAVFAGVDDELHVSGSGLSATVERINPRSKVHAVTWDSVLFEAFTIARPFCCDNFRRSEIHRRDYQVSGALRS